MSELGKLAVLADLVEQDEWRILAAALDRLEVADDKEERRLLFKVVEQARAVLGS